MVIFFKSKIWTYISDSINIKKPSFPKEFLDFSCFYWTLLLNRVVILKSETAFQLQLLFRLDGSIFPNARHQIKSLNPQILIQMLNSFLLFYLLLKAVNKNDNSYLTDNFKTMKTLLNIRNIDVSEAHSEPYQISKTTLFAEIVNGWKPFTIFVKSSILDIWLVHE